MTDVFIEVGPPLSYPITNGTNTVGVTPSYPGTYTLRIYDGSGVLLSESAPFVVAPNLPHTYTVSAADVASLGEAASAQLIPLSGPVDTLAFTETATVLIEFAGVASDALTLGDVASSNGSLQIIEVLDITETATNTMTLVSSADDGVTLGEAAIGATSGAPGTLSVTFRIKNTDTASISKPRVSIGHFFAPGDVPAGYKLQLYDATGITENLNFQQDMESYWKQDGSLKYAALSFISPDDFAVGAIFKYTLKGAIGTPSRTPNVSLAQLKSLMVANDIAWNFSGIDLGTDVFKVSTQDVLTNFGPLPWNPILATTASTTTGNTLTFASAANVSVGQIVTGSNIPAGASVVGLTSTTVSLSANVTGTGVANGASITFQYPFGGWEVKKSGSLCTEYKVWSYMRRVSDGLFHGWQMAALFVRLWGTNGPIEVITRVERPTTYGPMPGNTVGVNDRLVCNSWLSYGATTVATWGGTADPNNFTIPTTAFNVAGSYVTLPLGGNSPIYGGGTAVTFTSTGTLPAGIQPNVGYFLTPLPLAHPATDTERNYLLCYNRTQVAQALGNPNQLITWAPNKSVAFNSHIIQNGYVYFVYKAGVTAATGGGPSGSATFINDGTAQWTLAGAAFTSQGSGTITANMTIGTWQNTGSIGATVDCRRVWIPAGSGAAQWKGLVEHDFTYLTTQTRAVPCFDPSVANVLSFMVGPCRPYIQNTPVLSTSGSLFVLSNTGNSFNDERISYLNVSSANILFNQFDPVADQYANLLGIIWGDYHNSAYDERAGQPPTVNMGPNRSTTNPGLYPGLAPSNRTLAYLEAGGPYGIPRWIGGPFNFQSNDSGWTYNYAQMNDASHTPIPWFIPYLRTGDPIYYDIGRTQAIAMVGSINPTGTRNLTNVSVTNPYSGNSNYGCVTGPAQQARSWGWLLRAVGCAWHVMPPSDPIAPMVDDILEDSAAYVAAMPSFVATQAANRGWVPINLATGNNRSTEPWMNHIMFICAAMEAWRNEYSQWMPFMSDYMNKQFWFIDSDQGGCEGAADAQYINVSSAAGTGFNAGFYQTGLEQLESWFTAEPWTSATCGSHTGLLYGIGSAQAAKWISYGAANTPFPLPPQQYYMMARAAHSMAAVLGITSSSNIAKRITARMSQVSPVVWSTAQAASTQNNFVQWAIVEPASHS